MNDYITDLQLYALDIIQKNGLEAEFNRYMIEAGGYEHKMRYMLVDFLIQYTEKHADEVKL